MSKLKRFNKSNKKRNTIKLIVAFLLVAVVSAAISYAVYQKEDEVLFINARVGHFETNNIELAMTLDGEEINIPPEKNDLYTVTVNCDNATGRWDINEWGAMVTNITAAKVKCEVNFATPAPTLSNVSATSDKTSINLTYTASGIGINIICLYGTSEENYENEVTEVQNTGCNITGLKMDTIYYYQVCANNNAGEDCKTGSIKTKPEGNPISKVNIGDYIRMTPTATNYTVLEDLVGGRTNFVLNPSELNLWRVIKVNSDGTVEMVSVYASSTGVYFRGLGGYLNFVGGLNVIASQYTNSKYVIKTRHMGYSNQLETCSGPLLYQNLGDCKDDTGYETDTNLVKSALGTLKAGDLSGGYKSYWLATRYHDGDICYAGRWLFASTGDLQSTCLYYAYSNNEFAERETVYAIRPIITLKSTTEILSGDGTSTSPYNLN